MVQIKTNGTSPPVQVQKVWWLRLTPVATIFLLIFFLCFVLFALFQFYNSHITVNPIPLETTYKAEIRIPELPVQLLIPAIDVDAAVQLVGLAGNGTSEMGVPDNFTDVGWYKYGPRPGMQGSAVITGHLNGKNLPQAVFYNLNALEIDDVVEVVGQDGTTLTFKVVKIRTYSHNAPTDEVFASTDDIPRLNLITCGGEWLPNEKLYNQRTVVFTELANTDN